MLTKTYPLPTAAELERRVQDELPKYWTAGSNISLLSQALVKQLCTEHLPTATKVVCDITDQGGTTLVLRWVEDAAGDELDIDDDVTDQLHAALGNVEYNDVEYEKAPCALLYFIDLTSDFRLPETPKRDRQEFASANKVMGLLNDPDQVGTSEYRAVYDLLNDALACCAEGEDVLHQAIGIAMALQNEAAAVLRILKGEGQ